MSSVQSVLIASQLEHLSVVSLKKQIRVSNLAEGHSAILQNIPPSKLDSVEASSATVAGRVNEEPTTVATTDDLSEVADTDTPGLVENVPPGDESTFEGEDRNLLGVNISATPTGQGVTGEDDVQYGEVRTYTESSSTVAGEVPPQQKSSSSATVGVPPINLTAIPRE